MITGRQIRAARGLLRWRVEDLSKRTGLTREALTRMEDEAVQPREASLTKIKAAFEEHGVEFIGNNGVTVKDDQVTTLTGENVYIRLLEDVFHTLYKRKNPEALFFFVDNSKSPPAVVATHHRLREGGINCRYLCQASPKRLDFPLEDYRAVPDEFFHNNSAIVYGDKYATMLLDPETGTDQGAVIIRNPHIAAGQRNLFNLIWSKSEKVKK